MVRAAQDIGEKWRLLAIQARRDAETLPLGPERDQLVNYALQLDRSIQLDRLLSAEEAQPRDGE